MRFGTFKRHIAVDDDDDDVVFNGAIMLFLFFVLELFPMSWRYLLKNTQILAAVLAADDDLHACEGERDSEGEDSDVEEGPGNVDVEEGRVLAVLRELVERCELEELPGEGEGEKSDLRYRLVPPVPEVKYIEKRARKRGRPAGVGDGDS